jgi:hypothetical protein
VPRWAWPAGAVQRAGGFVRGRNELRAGIHKYILISNQRQVSHELAAGESTMSSFSTPMKLYQVNNTLMRMNQVTEIHLPFVFSVPESIC